MKFTASSPEWQTKLSKWRRDICTHLPQMEPFFFCFPFTVIEPDDQPMQTAFVCSKGAFFYRTFLETLPDNKARGLILHEVLHAALFHLSDPWIDRSIPLGLFRVRANIAQDLVIEGMIAELARLGKAAPAGKTVYDIDPKHLTICENFLPSETARFKGMSWRQVYEILTEEGKQQQGQRQGSGAPGQGQGTPSPFASGIEGVDSPAPESERGHEAFSDELAKTLKSAQEESQKITERLRSQGSGKGDFMIDVEPTEPVVHWTSILKDCLINIPTKSHKTWSRIKRRPFVVSGEYHPRLGGFDKALDHIRLFIDTSGSNHDNLSQIAGDLMQLFRELAIRKLDIIYYDDGVQQQITLTQDEIKTHEIKSMPGGGGTCVYKAMEEIALTPGYKPVPTIGITDGYDTFNVRGLPYDTLFWLTYGVIGESDAGVWIKAEV